jgi:hypothetical protein
MVCPLLESPRGCSQLKLMLVLHFDIDIRKDRGGKGWRQEGAGSGKEEQKEEGGGLVMKLGALCSR